MALSTWIKCHIWNTDDVCAHNHVCHDLCVRFNAFSTLRITQPDYKTRKHKKTLNFWKSVLQYLKSNWIHIGNKKATQIKSKLAYFDINKSFVVLPIAPLEAPMCCGQLLLCIIQAVQLLQAEVAPHYIQLQHRVIVNSIQQFCATLTGKWHHYFDFWVSLLTFSTHFSTLMEHTYWHAWASTHFASEVANRCQWNFNNALISHHQYTGH